MQSHSLFFESLTIRGHSIEYVQAESPELQLKSYGSYLFDNIIMFCPTIQEMNTITNDGAQRFLLTHTRLRVTHFYNVSTIADIIDFTNDGGNLFIGVDDGEMLGLITIESILIFVLTKYIYVVL